MAKQTFTTGQVLTAAQMTSLQQTAMGGGPATAKTANYVLVAADAGTTVAMNAASSTTITVNTGLFAAGDTVFIQNLGAGSCTITAGTATVATAGSLILPQNDAGILYFTSTSAAIFYDYIQAGAVSPLTTKGDLYTFSTSDARLPVGTNGYTLVADSTQTTGLKWQAPAGGTTFNLINSGGTTLSGATTTISSIPTDGTYNHLMIRIFGAYAASEGGFYFRINGDTGSNYQVSYTQTNNTSFDGYGNYSVAYGFMGGILPSSSSSAKTYNGTLWIWNYLNTDIRYCQTNFIGGFTGSNNMLGGTANTIYKGGSALSSVAFLGDSNLSGGTVFVYGVK